MSRKATFYKIAEYFERCFLQEDYDCDGCPYEEHTYRGFDEGQNCREKLFNKAVEIINAAPYWTTCRNCVNWEKEADARWGHCQLLDRKTGAQEFCSGGAAADYEDRNKWPKDAAERKENKK